MLNRSSTNVALERALYAFAALLVILALSSFLFDLYSTLVGLLALGTAAAAAAGGSLAQRLRRREVEPTGPDRRIKTGLVGWHTVIPIAVLAVVGIVSAAFLKSAGQVAAVAITCASLYAIYEIVRARRSNSGKVEGDR